MAARNKPVNDPGFLDHLVAWLSTTTPVASWWVACAAIAAGIFVAVHPATWRHTRLLATWVHETGHAAVALIFGRDVTAIRLDAGAGGVTEHRGVDRGLGRAFTAAAGYPAPAALAGFLLWATFSGHSTWAIAALVAVAAVMLPFQRSWRGLAVTIAIAAALWGLTRLDPLWATAGLLVLAGHMAAASPRTVVELRRARRSGRLEGAHSDADTLAALTGTGAPLWEIVFMAASLALPALGLYRAVGGG